MNIFVIILFVLFLHRLCCHSYDIGYIQREKDIFTLDFGQGFIVENGVKRPVINEDMKSVEFQNFLSGFDARIKWHSFFKNVYILGCTLSLCYFIGGF